MSSREDSKQRLLKAASRLLEFDVESVSVRAICAEADVQLPTLYHFFESKRGLIEAIAIDGFRTLSAALTTAIASNGPKSSDRMRAAFRTQIEFASTHAPLFCLMYGRAHSGGVRQAYLDATIPVTDLFEAAAAAGELSVSALDGATRLHAAAVGGALYMIRADAPNSQQAEAVCEAVLASILRARSQPIQPSDQVPEHAGALLSAIHTSPEALEPEERALFLKWLARLAQSS
ncbi:AcrR family transcriptional regulator [Microbacterium endophyticum]|uniref:AcrR family transcriptional regulator n=1 Tax=Microbacterium endophyticum TaxID=1526412 RepID=A0A7W4YMX6_9MICO|nr:TetR/AcrR family transcriptional regulator [Microbacterium endophyticum]MBB2975547.1 AcrR family transcriptional regulator [Microbacterium endophyticum]NIK35434.1 AcrR family transcriptional regulator [Microbacterium endophyticum]